MKDLLFSSWKSIQELITGTQSFIRNIYQAIII